MDKFDGYAAVFAAPAVAFLVHLPKRRQRRLLDEVRNLARDPFVAPDQSALDDKGREVAQTRAGDFTVDYWIDHAARQVVVLEIAHQS